MKRMIMIGGLLLALMAASPAPAEVMKIAYIDVQRVLGESNAGKKARSEFRAEIDRLQRKLERQQKEVQSLKDELEKKGMLMKDDERRNLQDEYARKLRDFERAYKDDKDELEKKDNEVTGLIVRDIARVIRQLGEERGYTLVMEKGSILWGAPSIDITDEVIRTYNASGGAKIGSLSGKPEPEEEAGAGSSSFGREAAKRSTISK